MYSVYGNRINFLVFYISEAHAMDEWPLSTNDTTPQHKTIEDRIEAAKRLNASFPLDCDSFERNNFEKIYSGWPERAYIIHENVIKHISYHKVDGYDEWHEDVERWIQNYLKIN